ncbi:thioredoxin-disulfide reductase [Fusibacter ferrireducens]|uniref:Thioredoxin reductase n=1 Tax=Fusibacter ferrireducens TaxID=2785058 RepID=A0ABR9ZUB4_9FIRM|nr:thioredoxin-disulfide reductase [Fusibacter ferrireducens]MBF4694028.1 thioredoxin-disulfide reductase [Fusibacter ferrireducens]
MLYDVIIIGAGPAGLSSGLYAARAKMNTLIIEKDKNGGQITGTDEVANYPGAMPEVTGTELVARMVEQCDAFGTERLKATVERLDLQNDIKKVYTDKGLYEAKSIILCMGAVPRKLGVPNEIELTGKGVSYCATCDADFFTDLEVYVVGGGDTALEEGIFITKFARKVTVIHRRDTFRAAKSIVEKALKNPKMAFIYDSGIKEILGDGLVQGFVLENFKTGEVKTIMADENDGIMGIFIFAGYLPETHLVKDMIELNELGYIQTDENMKTNIPGVFAAGDIRVKSLRQVVTATADGAIAAVQAEKYVDEHFGE